MKQNILTAILLTISIGWHTNGLAQYKLDGLLPESNREFDFDYTELNPVKFKSFEEAATWADVVAIAQVVNIDYKTTRDLNAEGQAFLNVHVPYKGVSKNELLIVSSKGFESHQCYYPDRLGEGERFLVFLKKSKNDGEYLGFKPYCQLQILLTDTGEYALRYPLEIDFKIDETLVKNIQFQDPNSQIDATDWTGISRDEHQTKFKSSLSKDEDMFQKFYYLTYTQGVMIYEIRKLLNIPAEERIKLKRR